MEVAAEDLAVSAAEDLEVVAKDSVAAAEDLEAAAEDLAVAAEDLAVAASEDLAVAVKDSAAAAEDWEDSEVVEEVSKPRCEVTSKSNHTSDISSVSCTPTAE